MSLRGRGGGEEPAFLQSVLDDRQSLCTVFASDASMQHQDEEDERYKLHLPSSVHFRLGALSNLWLLQGAMGRLRSSYVRARVYHTAHVP